MPTTKDNSRSPGGETTKRGFAAMDPQRQKEISAEGGRAAHEKGTAHEFTSEEARVAGRKGGEAVSKDRSHMAEIGQKGGEARGANSARSGSSRNRDQKPEPSRESQSKSA